MNNHNNCRECRLLRKQAAKLSPPVTFYDYAAIFALPFLLTLTVLFCCTYLSEDIMNVFNMIGDLSDKPVSG